MTTRRTFLKTTAGAGAGLLLGRHAVALPAGQRRALPRRSTSSSSAARAISVRIRCEKRLRAAIASPCSIAASIKRSCRRRDPPPGRPQHREARTSTRCAEKSGTPRSTTRRPIPRGSRRPRELLKDSVQYYLYVSSTGVFFPYRHAGFIKEDVTPIVVDPDGHDERATACESAVGNREHEGLW